MKNSAIGSTFASFLEEENIKEDVETMSEEKIIALQLRNKTTEPLNTLKHGISAVFSVKSASEYERLEKKTVKQTTL